MMFHPSYTKNGFELIDFQVSESCKRYHSRSDLNPNSYRIVWGDAIYINSPYDFNKERAFQSSIILATLGYCDLALYILNNIPTIPKKDKKYIEKIFLKMSNKNSLKQFFKSRFEKLTNTIVKGGYNWRTGKKVKKYVEFMDW